MAVLLTKVYHLYNCSRRTFAQLKALFYLRLFMVFYVPTFYANKKRNYRTIIWKATEGHSMKIKQSSCLNFTNIFDLCTFYAIILVNQSVDIFFLYAAYPRDDGDHGPPHWVRKAEK